MDFYRDLFNGEMLKGKKHTFVSRSELERISRVVYRSKNVHQVSYFCAILDIMVLEGRTTYEPRLITSADGTEICADAVGNRTANCPVLVLIHGFSVIKEAFNPMFEDPQWIHHTFLVRYDARGHGQSGKPLADEAWESHCMSEDFEAVCKEFGVKKAFILGWSLGAAHFADIMTHAKSVDVTGLINVEGAPYIDTTIIARVAKPETMVILATLTHPPSVDAFQHVVMHFLRSCSDVMPGDLYRRLLEGVVLQPRAVTAKLITRKQDSDKFLREGREGKLELLVVRGGKDKLIDNRGLEAVYRDLGWKKYTLRHLDEADHLPWISSPEEFRDVVLGWMMERST